VTASASFLPTGRFNSEETVRSASLLRKSIVEKPAGIIRDGWLTQRIQNMCQCGAMWKCGLLQCVTRIAAH
jgi:hypothetical protein